MRYHGADLHKRFAAISVRDESSEQIRYLARVENFAEYVAGLGVEDVVVLESSSGSFWWAQRIQRQGARCVVIDPHRFRIIRDSWHKTDRRDAAALSLALWMSARSGELVLPEVWQPTPAVRELRRLFAQWKLLTTQIRQLKAQVQGVLLENGISDSLLGHRMLAYLRVVPTVRSCGGTTHVGHINRCSRQLCRTLFTQSVLHLAASSPTIKRFYQGVLDRKAHGRARIAVLRKTCGMMRRMLLNKTEYKWKEPALFEGKLRDYLRIRDSRGSTKAA
jgi:transposase